jgi:hypothetical protein
LENKEVIVPLNKIKLRKYLGISIVFVGIGVYILTIDAEKQIGFLNDNFLLKMVGIILILFFSISLVYYIKKWRDKKPALIINNDGILDNTSMFSVGHILWKDTKYISVEEVYTNRSICIFLDNADKYLNRQTNFLKRKFMQLNSKKRGLYVTFPEAALDYNFDELNNILKSFFNEQKELKNIKKAFFENDN